jgi:hypothetical protein
MRNIRRADAALLHRSIPASEMDPQFDAFVQRTLPFLVCDPSRLPPDESVYHGMGWWSNLMTSADFAQRRRNPKQVLVRSRTLVLILRGGCDYLRLGGCLRV